MSPACAERHPHDDQRRLIGGLLRGAKRLVHRRQVVAVVYLLHMPTVRGEPRADVLGERHRRRSGKRDGVLVVKGDQLAEPQVAGERARLGLDAFHHVAVACNHVREVVDDLVAGPVEACRQVRLRDGHANGVRDALAKRPRRRLDAWCEMALRVTGCEAAPLSEALDLFEGDVVAGQIEE